MRVEKVDLYNTYNKAASSKYCNAVNLNGNARDFVSFGNSENESEPKKLSFSERIKNLFGNKNKMTPEREKSEEIKGLIGGINSFSKRFKSEGRIQYSMAKNLIAIGSFEDFRNYTVYDKKNNMKAIYGEIDEFTGMPTSITTVKDAFKVERVYNLYDGLNLMHVADYTVPGHTVLYDVLDKQIISYSDTNNETGETMSVALSDNGFYYFLGTLDENGNPALTKAECMFSYDDNPDNSYYRELNENGETDEYRYSSAAHMWLKKENN